MTDEKRLPVRADAQNEVATTKQGDSLVSRGLEAVRNRGQSAAPKTLSDEDLEKLFMEACERHDYDTALPILQVLDARDSPLVEELGSHLINEGEASCLSNGDGEEDEAYEREMAEIADKVDACLRKAANRGDALAQDLLGWLYCSHGSWVRDDPRFDAEAVKWSRLAAEQGRRESQLNLAMMYYNGRKCVRQDYAEAMKLFRKAASQNSMYSLFKIADMFYSGEGVGQDHSEALRLYRDYAERGDDIPRVIDAQFKLATMYYRGEGVPKDYVEAYMWLAVILGRSRFDFDATELRDELAPKMTPAQIVEAQRLAGEWVAKHPAR